MNIQPCWSAHLMRLAIAICLAISCRFSVFAAKLSDFLPPPVVSVPDSVSSKLARHIHSGSGPLYLNISEEFEEEQIRFRELLKLSDAEGDHVNVLVLPAHPIVPSPLLRIDERPAIIQTLQNLGPPIFVTDFDRQARWEELASSPAETAHSWSRPSFELVGEISVFDERTIERERELDLGVMFSLWHTVFEPSVRESRQEALSVLQFSVRVRNAQSKLYIPFAHARVRVIIGKTQQQNRFGLMLLNSGGSLAATATATDGLGLAEDFIVSRGSLLVLTKLFGLPGHRIFRDGGEYNPEMKNAAYAFFSKLPPQNQVALLQHLLRLNGYSGVVRNGQLDELTKAALLAFATKLEIPNWESDLAEVYRQLTETAPLSFEPLVAGSKSNLPPERGVTICFQGFPPSQFETLQGIIRTLNQGHSVQKTGSAESFAFCLDQLPAANGLENELPLLFHQRSGRMCRVEMHDPHRLVAYYESGF